MKLFVLFFLFFNTLLFSSEIVQVKISKIHGLVSFVHALGDASYRVKSYKEIYLKHYNKNSLDALKQNISKISRSKNYTLIKQESTFCQTIYELKVKLKQHKLNPNAKILSAYLKHLKHFLPIYEKLIFNDSKKRLYRVKKALVRKMQENDYDALILKAAHFYGVDKKAIPVIYLSLYPITQGNSTLAFMLGDVESIGVLVHKKKLNLDWLLSATIFHEIVHTFYKINYDAIKQHLYANKFVKYKEQKVFNESLATAFGAGWAFHKLTAKQSNGRWYNNNVYDKTAKAIYPVLNEYMQKKKKLDSAFVKKMYKLYLAVLLHK